MVEKSAEGSAEAKTTDSRDTGSCKSFKALQHETSPPHRASFA
jgi:hypothetical protein